MSIYKLTDVAIFLAKPMKPSLRMFCETDCKFM